MAMYNRHQSGKERGIIALEGGGLFDANAAQKMEHLAVAYAWWSRQAGYLQDFLKHDNG